MPAADRAAGALLSVGRVGRPHGLDGSFYVTQPRTRLLEGREALIVNGEQVAIVRRAGTDPRPILRLAGVETREAVDALRGTDLWVRRTDAPPLDEDEWYAEDLVGCRVADGEREVGVVAKLLPYPSCELLEVERADGPNLLIPLISDAVRTVDVDARRIDVNLTFLGEES